MLPGFPGATVPDWVRQALDDGLAGVVVYGQNASAPGVVERLGRELRALRPDALVAVDEEGGDVTRLHQHQGSPQPGNAALGRVDDPELTRRLARLTALELRAAGYNLNFAPVADLDEEALSAVIGLRSFGGDPDGVGAHVAAAVAGLQEAGVAACPKHFPGHGATRVDSHLSLPRVEEPLEVLMRRELVPFRAGVAAGARCVMTAHIVYPAIDEQPATLSRAVLIGLLRETLAFEGVIVTDALEMRAVRDQYGIAGAAVRALAAGADLLCLGAERGGEDAVHAVIDAVAAALADGTLTAGRLEEAGARVDALRHWCATAPPADGAAMEAGDGTLPLEVARRALAADGRVPRSDAVALLEVRAPANQAVGSTAWGLAPALGAQGGLAAAVAVEEEPHDVDALLQPLEGLPLVVVTRDAVTRPWQRALVARVLARRPDAVLVAMGTPRDLDLGAGRGVSTAGAGRVNATAAAERLLRSRRPREGGDRGDVKDAGRPGARMAAEMLEQPAVLERIGERRHEWAAADHILEQVFA